MDELRLVLLVAGLALIAGIYLRERHRRRREEIEREWYDLPPETWEAGDGAAGPESGIRARDEGLPDPDALGALAGISARRERGPAPGGATAGADDELVIAITVMARGGATIDGATLAVELDRLGLRHGDLGIFHCHAGAEGEGPVLFSLANVVQPGTLDPATLDELATPGIALFVRVPGPPEPKAAFERMVETAGEIAERCGAVVCDAARNPLSTQGANHLRDQLAEYGRRHRH